MISAGLPPNEAQRLQALQALQLLDTGPEPRFDVLTRLASRTLGVPIALVSLVDGSRQWFKSKFGLEATETSRDVAFCAHVVEAGEMLVVPDATQDIRFFDNPLVTGELGLRAYAGVPLKTSRGFAMGTLCALDQKPHVFTEAELETLKDLAALAQREIIACETVTQWQSKAQQSAIAQEVAEAANAAKTRFVSNMSHELRTPLNAVLGYARRLQRSDMDADQRSDLKKLQIAGESLLSLVNDVLDMSKIEAGEFQLAQDPLDLDLLFSDLDSMMGVTAASKRLSLHFKPRPVGMPRHYLGDAMRLRQILVNLVGNALKFTEQGQIDVRVTPMPARQVDRLRLRFEVQDTGVGIEAAELPQLFNRFVQAQTSHPGQHGGTGLGLAIVKELAERMAGLVDVQSQQGVGSTFAVEVELQVATEPQPCTALGAAEGTSEAVTGMRLQNKKILLVDDSPSNLDIAASMLTDEGADVFVCTDGRAALDWLTRPEHQADVVLMDVHMPVMDGNTAVAAIRKHPVLARLPVIAMTASSTLTERQASLTAGMSDYVLKPIRHEQLMAALLRHC